MLAQVSYEPGCQVHMIRCWSGLGAAAVVGRGSGGAVCYGLRRWYGWSGRVNLVAVGRFSRWEEMILIRTTASTGSRDGMYEPGRP